MAYAHRLGPAAVVLGGVILILGFVADFSAPLVAAVACGPVALLQAGLIIEPTLRTRTRPARTRHGRSIRLLGAGVLITGLTTVAAGWCNWMAPTATIVGLPLDATVTLVGLFLAICGYLLGLVLMPGTQLTRFGRLRRLLDGVAMALCGFFVSWLLLFSGDGLRFAGFTAIVMSCVAFCAMVVTGLRAAAGRAASISCGAGIALSIAGLTQLIVALDYHDPANRVIGSGVAVLIAPILIHRATQAVVCGGPILDPVDGDADFGGYPLFALPMTAAMLAWAHHFVQRQGFDSTAIALAVTSVVAVTLRGAVASVDARRYASRLTAREAHFRSLFSGSTDVIMVLDPELRVRWQSPAAARQLGLSDQDVVGRPFIAQVHPEDDRRAADYLAEVVGDPAGPPTPIEVRLRDGFGMWRDIEWKIIDHRAVPAVASLVVHLRDVGDRVQLQHTLSRVALADQLTGLPNRRNLNRTMGASTSPGVLIVLRLLGVAGVYDARGHDVGDAVMVEAARRIRAGAARSDVVVRLDGDRFAVLTGAGAVQAQFLGTRLLTILAEPYPLPDGPAHLSASAGLAEFVPGTDGDEVLRRAELVLGQGGYGDRGGAVEWYDASVEADLQRRFAIEQALPGLLNRSELDLRYQPIVDLRTNRPAGAEAVLRWRHPGLGIIPTEEFLPVAERLGLAGQIGEWMLHRTCRELSGWLRDRHDVWLSLDVTVGLLAEPTFVAAVESALENHQVSASRLVLELAEPGLTVRSDSGRHGTEVDPGADARAEAVTGHLTELRAMGVRVALDHFGTAATSLSRLRVMAVDLLKVDRQLLDPPARQTGPAPAVIDVVVRLSEQWGMVVAAQGLDSQVDMDAALTAGCHLGQGDLICRPVPAEHLEAYLDHHRTPQR